MSKPSRKKNKKRKDRQKSLQNRANEKKAQQVIRQRIISQAAAYSEKYPEIFVEKNDADPLWIEAVEKAIITIDLDDPDSFAFDLRNDLRHLKKHGAGETLRKLEAESDQTDRNLCHLEMKFVFAIGQSILDRIPHVSLKFLPFNDLEVLPDQDSLLIRLRSMKVAKRSGGKLYYSSHSATPKLDGRKIGFCHHSAKERLERITPGWESYAGLGDAFGVLNDLMRFDPVTLRDGNAAVRIFEKCTEGFFNNIFPESILGDRYDPTETYYHLSAYAPYDVDEDFIRLKTFLSPGFFKTPEYELIVQGDLSETQKASMKNQARDQDREYLQKTHDFSLVKWFHENGIPQIITHGHELYSLF